MKVFVVVKCISDGDIAGVFSTLKKASEYVENHKYSAFIITEHTVDSYFQEASSHAQKENNP